MSKFVTNIAWSDVPHLTEKMKASMRSGVMPYQLEAREKGVPVLGAGAIYPVTESDLVVEPFPIPPHWAKFYALDVGWNRTAALFGALDRDSDIIYWYSEHYMAHEKPPVHADAIKARGAWIPGVIDPAARGRSQADGEKLYAQYLAQGLTLSIANNAVESGIYKVWERKSAGLLKVFSTCKNYLFEHRIYRRDDKGKVVKSNDHLMDCERYGVVSGPAIAKATPGAFGNRPIGGKPNHTTEWDVLTQLASESKMY